MGREEEIKTHALPVTPFRGVVFIAGLTVAESVRATVYTDATGDNNGPRSISPTWPSPTPRNLTFQINLNPSATSEPSREQRKFRPVLGKYQIGIQTGPGGNPAIVNNFGNQVGISTGVNFFIGCFLGDDTSPRRQRRADRRRGMTPRITGTVRDGMTSQGTRLLRSWIRPRSSPTHRSATPFHSRHSGSAPATRSSSTSGQPSPAAGSRRTTRWTRRRSQPIREHPTERRPPYDGATSPGSTLSSYTIASVITGPLWTGKGNGHWTESGNWNGGIPNAIDQTANFGSLTSGNYAVALDDAGETVGTINLDGATSYTIGTIGGNALTMQVSVGSAGSTSSAAITPSRRRSCLPATPLSRPAAPAR